MTKAKDDIVVQDNLETPLPKECPACGKSSKRLLTHMSMAKACKDVIGEEMLAQWRRKSKKQSTSKYVASGKQVEAKARYSESGKKAETQANYVESGKQAEAQARYVESGKQAEAQARYVESGKQTM